MTAASAPSTSTGKSISGARIAFWGKNRAALAAATRLSVSTDIAATYARLAALYADRDAAVEAILVRKKTVDLIGDRFHKALENESALERVRSAETVAEAELSAIDENIALTRNALAAMIGAGPDRSLAIKRPKAIGGRFTVVPKALPEERACHLPQSSFRRRRSHQCAACHCRAAGADLCARRRHGACAGRRISQSGEMIVNKLSEINAEAEVDLDAALHRRARKKKRGQFFGALVGAVMICGGGYYAYDVLYAPGTRSPTMPMWA
ncbi:hypothetical protein [Breoghania sp.]|uniref:hypothetical protein n=1 Tax=Breoghania sp. TaxID=2065378 RepID=UPI00261E5E8F|nr:hypothetical protein [Breoghania sp.]MDJ0931802.1 hypothetical protein [Breoghania sp.]